ncbi:MAG: hypothetical protein Q9191_004746 [Dirinaria sp. TL-2023a]
MLGRANYIALVGGGKQPKFPQNKVGKALASILLGNGSRLTILGQVIIWDDAKQKAVITLEFRSPVNRVCLSRSRIVIALHNSVHVYAFSVPPEKLSIYETANNPLGLCCLGSKIVAFPGRTPGQVQLVEIATGNISIIPAHSSSLRAMEISPDGEVLATASETGTLVRTFSTSNCARTGELRRGVDHAVVFSIAISPSSRLLALTSDKSTLHIFDLPHLMHGTRSDSPAGRSLRSLNGSIGADGGEEGNNKKWGLLGKIPLMPRVFSDIYSFASAHFETDDDPKSGLEGPAENVPIPGIPGGKPKKGVIGWADDHTILVIGAGRDGRWEKFILGEGDDGRRRCIRQGWKRYLGS